MRKWLILSICLIFSGHAFPQGGMYGFNFGLGYTTSYRPYITPAFEGYHLWRLSPHFYAGGSLFLQRYSFRYDVSPPAATVNYGDALSIRQRTSYLFFSPKLDVGIGYRNKVHISFFGGMGVVMSSSQKTTEFTPLLVTSGGNIGADTNTFNTSYNIPKIIYRAGMGVSEKIATHGYFNILLTEEFSYIPSQLSKGDLGFTTSYISFTVGLVHKYPQVWREVD